MKFTRFDAAAYLKTDRDVACYLTAILNENDPDLLLAALNDIARSRGIANLAETADLYNGCLPEVLETGAGLHFDTVLRILHSLNIRLEAVPVQEAVPDPQTA